MNLTAEMRTLIRAERDRRRREIEGAPADGRKHGTENEYGRGGCRCDECKRAAAEGRKNRAKRKAEVQINRRTERWRRVRASIGETSREVDADTQADLVCLTLKQAS